MYQVQMSPESVHTYFDVQLIFLVLISILFFIHLYLFHPHTKNDNRSSIYNLLFGKIFIM